MAARQLPKLKTRVRFPSPAPKIEPVLRRLYFWIVVTEANPIKRGRKQVDFASVAWRNRYGLPAGIYAEGFPSPAPKIEPVLRRLYFWIVVTEANPIRLQFYLTFAIF